MIAYLKNLSAKFRRNMDLHKKAHHYRNILTELEYLEYRDLNSGEQIWNRLHREYFERKVKETKAAIDGRTDKV